MWEEVVKKSKLYLSLTEDTDEPNAFEIFVNTLVQRYGNLQPIKDFFEINDGPYYIFKWSLKHLEMIHANPIILNILEFINIENATDLIIAYGFWCEDANMQPCYYMPDGTPCLGGNVEGEITRRRCDGSLSDMAKNGAIISLLQCLNRKTYSMSDLSCPFYDIDLYVAMVNSEAARRDPSGGLRRHRAGDPRDRYTKAVGISMLKATKKGQVETLKYLRLLRPWLDDIIYIAINSGHLDIVKYVCENGALDHGEQIEIDGLAKTKVEIFKYLHDERRILIRNKHKFIENLFHYGNYGLYEYLTDENPEPNAFEVFINIRLEGTIIPEDDYLNFVKYFREHGLAWPNDFFFKAIKAGNRYNLELVEYLCENGCPMNSKTFKLASMGSFEVVKCLHDHGCPIPTIEEERDDMSLLSLVLHRNFEIVGSLISHFLEPGALPIHVKNEIKTFQDDIRCMIFIDSWFLENQKRIFKFLKDCGYKGSFNKADYGFMINYNKLELVRYLDEIGYVIDFEFCYSIIERETGPIDEKTGLYIVENPSYIKDETLLAKLKDYADFGRFCLLKLKRKA